MDETAALRHLITTLEDQVARQCATITRLQQENRQLQERLTAAQILEALGPEVEPELEAPEVDDWMAQLETLFGCTRRQN